MYKITRYVLMLLLIGGCAGQDLPEVPERIKELENLTVFPVDAKPEYTISLEPETAYSGSEEVLFSSRIGNVEVDDSGRVYIPDLAENKIHVFDEEGSFIQSVGREGRGPGEFRRIWDIEVADNMLHVLDYIHQKISVFESNSLSHTEDLPISINKEKQPSWVERTQKNKFLYRPIHFSIRHDGKYLIFFGDEGVAPQDNINGRTYEVSLYNPVVKRYTQHDLLSFAWTGSVLFRDSGEGSTVMFEVPYKRSSQFDYAGEQLVYGWTEDYLFKFYDEEGQYQRAFYYPFDKKNLKQEDVLSYYKYADDQSKEALRNDTYPETWPAFHSVVMDDQSRLWVSSFTDELDELEWRVFEQSGKWLGSFRLPISYELQAVKGNYAYIKERDSKTGALNIRQYSINME